MLFQYFPLIPTSRSPSRKRSFRGLRVAERVIWAHPAQRSLRSTRAGALVKGGFIPFAPLNLPDSYPPIGELRYAPPSGLMWGADAPPNLLPDFTNSELGCSQPHQITRATGVLMNPPHHRAPSYPRWSPSHPPDTTIK